MTSGFLNTYVLDTNAIINLYLLELGGKKVLDKIPVVYIPEKVRQELYRVIRRENIDDLYSYCLSRPNVKMIPTSEFSQCVNFTKFWIKSKHHFNPLDEGELQCLALSLLLSRKNKFFIALVTEENTETVEIIREFMALQRVGVVLSPIELMISLYCRERIIKENQIKRAIREYQLRLKRKKGDFGDIDEMLADLCRKKGISKNLCSQECFSSSDSF